MLRKRFHAYLLVAVLGVFWISAEEARGQAAPEMIVFNGKIVTMSDKSFTSNLGTTAQAMSLRDGKVVAVGTNAQIRGQAGPNTKQIDLEGRTVVPGLIVVHDHPYDWAPQNPYAIKKVLSDDIVVTRYMEGPPEEQAKAFPGVLQEAVSKAKSGQWIFIVFSLGDKYQYKLEARKYGNVLDRKMIPLELVNRLAPNNPVFLRDPFTGAMVNSAGMDVIEKVFPNEDMRMNRNTGGGGGSVRGIMDWGFHEVVMRDHYKELKEMHRLELSWWASLGVGAFASRAYTPSNLKVYHDLSQAGEMPVRNAWTWGWRESFFNADPYVLNTIVLLEGTGNDFFWNVGGWGVERVGSGCTTAPLRAPVDPPPSNRCSFDPSDQHFRRLVEFVKAGGRVAALHMGGDLDVEYLMEAIEKGSKEAGFTPEQIRAKRHAWDHLTMSPRPDQIERIKRLGMAVGGAPFFYMENAPQIFERYGEDAVQWSVPKKSLIDAQVPTGFEIDRPLATTSLTVYWTLARFLDRKAADGRVYAPNQRISRELALKSATIWGAYYLMKEDKLGALEPGTFADFMVLDRDYLTIPESDIENIRVLGTVSGGKVRHLVPSLARKWGMQPTGAQVELGGPAAQW
ncbi:MAG: amidohydrolase family protein [Acidobacteria bacterium]|nr:amidohydrolase family protein [Acidobacteriota bacterium]